MKDVLKTVGKISRLKDNVFNPNLIKNPEAYAQSKKESFR